MPAIAVSPTAHAAFLADMGGSLYGLEVMVSPSHSAGADSSRVIFAHLPSCVPEVSDRAFRVAVRGAVARTAIGPAAAALYGGPPTGSNDEKDPK
jgi:hypothetical protein